MTTCSGSITKHLVLCLDGTWCDADKQPEPQSNVALLSGMIDPRLEDGSGQRIYYDPGVGTGRGRLDRILGGAFGKGLSENVLAAYRFLSQFYSSGDLIYVFGFSRGAFTARSLCGFLAASGLLTRDMCNPSNLEFAWSYYRTPPKLRYPADRARLSRISHGSDARVRFLGVFDTVGALGVPSGFGARKVQFHDTDVSSIVDYSCQALAIDEHRPEFEAAVWTEPRHRNFRVVEQAWFPGSHANVGGGCEDTGLSDLALEWMLQRLVRHCPELKLRPSWDWPRQLSPNYLASLYEPRSWLFWRGRWRPLIRLINRQEVDRTWRLRRPKIRPHSRVIGEMVHWSALARWQETKDGARRVRYRPPNLLAAIGGLKEQGALVVGPNGEPTRLSGLHANSSDISKPDNSSQPNFNGEGRPG